MAKRERIARMPKREIKVGTIRDGWVKTPEGWAWAAAHYQGR